MEAKRQAAFVLAEQISGAPVLPALAPQLGAGAPSNTLFQQIPEEDWAGAIRLARPDEPADAILVPHHWRWVEKRADTGYLERLVAVAKEKRLPIVVVAFSDDHRAIPVPAAVFRPSLYRSLRRENEIAMPAYVEDLGRGESLPPVWGEKPTVGFVGRAGWNGPADLARYIARSFLAAHPFKDGRYYRRDLAAALAKDSRVDCRFVFRRRYSGHRASIELSPEDARREYVENMLGAAYGLAPKGDGNYSLRFYELLSLGRIPIVPDTEMVMPLEDLVAYDRFSLSVPRGESPVETLVGWHRRAGEAGLAEASAAARDAFSRYLYAPRFFATATEFSRLSPTLEVARRLLLG